MKLLRTFLFIVCALSLHSTYAQNLMNIHQGNGTLIQIPLESIDSVRFVTVPPPTIQKIFQSNGNILSIAVSDIDSITYTIPNSSALATLSTQAVTVLSSSSAYSGGTITSDGGSAITQRGVCWSTSPNPTLANNFSIDGTGIGSFGSNLGPLQSATTYYVRAYAANSEGTAYGNQLVFTTSNPSTSGSLATISTAEVIYTDGLTASCGGNITADGGLAVTARGVCWAIGTTPTINNSVTIDGSGGGSFSSTLPNLLPNTSYFVRAYATNDAGTVYGITYSFTTHSLPTITTNSISSITGNSAQSGGTIINNGGSNIIQKGICWSILPSPTVLNNFTQNGGINASFTSNINGLVPATTYYVRAYAINGVGVSYGNVFSFTTIAVLPTIISSPISNITSATAESGGIISDDGGAQVTQRGVCWGINPNPTTANFTTNNGSGIGSFTSNLTMLTPNTLYYFRAYAINSVGTVYGSQESFTTTPGLGLGVQFNGHFYPSFVYSNGQEWMTENLRTAAYANGDPIPNVVDSATWVNNTSGAWIYPNNSSQFEDSYGKLYNGFAIYDQRNVCPNGWHVSTDEDWTSLVNLMDPNADGGNSFPNIAGGKLKSSGTVQAGTGLWESPNLGATNESGFSGNPAGIFAGSTNYFGSTGNWWSPSTFDIFPFFRGAQAEHESLYRNTDWIGVGKSIRCLRNSNPAITIPILSSLNVSDVSYTNATCFGQILSTGGSEITQMGFYLSTTPYPTDANQIIEVNPSLINFTSQLTALNGNTTYYVRAFARNSVGIGYGNVISFTTLAGTIFNQSFNYGYLVDQEGNNYQTIIIGSQEWMAENLRTTTYANGDPIPNETDGIQWQSLTTGAWVHYNNESQYENPYGNLYNWYTVVDPRNVCPTGWHVPSDDEWTVLTDYLGGTAVAGGKMKSTGTQYWQSPNTAATNESGFSGLAGGQLIDLGNFNRLGEYGYWWSSNESSTTNAWCRAMSHTNGNAVRGGVPKMWGYSVRCIRD